MCNHIVPRVYIPVNLDKYQTIALNDHFPERIGFVYNTC